MRISGKTLVHILIYSDLEHLRMSGEGVRLRR